MASQIRNVATGSVSHRQGRRRFARRALARSKALFRHQTPRGRNQPAPLLDPRLGGVGARGRRDLSRRSGLPAPIGLAGIYTSTLRRQYRLVLFRKQGWLYPLLSRRLLVTLFWTGWALATSFLLLLLRFHVYGWVEWTVLAATIPVFALVFAAIRRVLVMGTAR